MRRGGGPPQVTSSVPTTLGLPFPQGATEVLTKLAKHVRLCGNTKHRGPIAQLAEFQQLLDNDVFYLTQDQFRITDLTPHQQFVLLDVFMRFFKEKSDDPNRNTYFELIFLGRDGDPLIHNHRMEVLLNFCSYALQTAVFQVYNMTCQYFSKTSTPRSYGEKLVAKLVEHFIKPDISRTMHHFLLPLEAKCAEFTAFFIVYAHRSTPVTASLAMVMGRYMSVNCNYLLCQFKDSTWMAEEFANVVFPKCVEFVLAAENQPKYRNAREIPEEEREKEYAPSTLFSGLLQMIQRWHFKVKDIALDTDPIFDKSLPWSRRRRDFLCAIACLSPAFHSTVLKNLKSLTVPQHLLEEISFALRNTSSAA